MLMSDFIKHCENLLKENGDGQIAVPDEYTDRCGDPVYDYETDFSIEVVDFRKDFKFLIDA